MQGGGGRRAEQVGDVGGGEAVIVVGKVVVHRHLAPFLQDGLDFGQAQAPQQGADLVPVHGPVVSHRAGREDPHRFLVEQAGEEDLRRQAEEFRLLQGVRQARGPVPAVRVAVVGVGQLLQEQAGGALAVGGQPQARRGLLGLGQVVLEHGGDGIPFQGCVALEGLGQFGNVQGQEQLAVPQEGGQGPRQEAGLGLGIAP